MKDLVIVGSSGFAKEIKWIIDRINDKELTYNFIGYIDDTKKDLVVGDDSFLDCYENQLAVVIAISNPKIRSKLAERYQRNKHLFFPNIIDPSVLMAESVSLGMGNIICAGSIMTVDISVADFCIFNLDCTVGHGSVIDNFVTVNPSVNISGNVVVSEGASIGTGAQLLQGLKIGKNSVVGAGAVVIEEIPDNCVAVGVPAKKIR